MSTLREDGNSRDENGIIKPKQIPSPKDVVGLEVVITECNNGIHGKGIKLCVCSRIHTIAHIKNHTTAHGRNDLYDATCNHIEIVLNRNEFKILH